MIPPSYTLGGGGGHPSCIPSPDWDLTGLALALADPTVPRAALTNPVRDWTGLANWVERVELREKCMHRVAQREAGGFT